MRYYEIIKEGYKEVQQKYITAGIDPETIENTFNTYKDLVNRNQLSGNERNIDWWGKLPFDQFKAFVDEKSSKHSTTQVKRSKIPGKSINLVDNDNWHIVIPLDKDSSCFHGKNSDWCTTKPYQYNFEDYFYDREIILIYCKNNNTGGMWAISAHKDTNQIEMFDQKDKSITKETFNSQTGLDVDKIVAEALKHQPNISSSRTPYKEASARIMKYLNSDNVGRNEQIEKDLILTKNGKLCYEYIKKVGKEDYPEIIQFVAGNYDGYSMVVQFIKNPSEKVQLEAVTEDERAIKYIDNPTEKVQLAAITQDIDLIKYIKNPSEQVQLAAVTKNGREIKHIIEKGITPSEKVQLAAVTQDGYGNEFKYIIDAGIEPSEKVQLAAVTQDGEAIRYIDNPSEELQLLAVTQYGGVIGYIIEKGITPSEQVQLAAVMQDGEAIKYIENPSEQLQLAAITQYWDQTENYEADEKFDLSTFRYIIKNTKIQLAAVTRDGTFIDFIIQHDIIPSEKVQLAAVTQNREAIEYIDNPSKAVKKAAGL